jgi:GNAT superfamily N-acetyltransferase
MARRIVTAREQVEMLSPWRREALIKEARYPQEWSGKAPYGYLPSGRARNRPPSVLSDPNDPDSEVLDPSEIRYEQEGDSVSAYHPINGDHLGNYSWDDDGGHAHIGIAMVDPKYQGQGVGGGIIDHIREHHQPNLVHSGYQGNGSLSYQGRAGALRDLGNTEEEHNDYFNTTPYNFGESQPSQFRLRNPGGGTKIPDKTDAQQRAHNELMQQFEEDKNHPNFTGVRSRLTRDENMYDEYGDRHEYGYDTDGDYVGLQDGIKDSDGYSEEGYDREGYNRDGLNSSGVDRDGYDEDGFSGDTGLDRDGKTRHGYTPGDGTPPEGTIPMSQMASYRFPTRTRPAAGFDAHQKMMDDAASRLGITPTMYAVRNPLEVSPNTGSHHVGNGDTLYSSLERARQVAYHPDDPSKDKNIVSVDYLDSNHLHTDASGKTPEDFHYAPDSRVVAGDVEDTASTPADLVHDPQRHQRVLSDLGHGWKQSTESPFAENSGFDYTDPNSGRSGRMYHMGNGTWATQHQPEFGRRRQNRYDNHREAADAIRQGTAPGPTMEHHAMEVNNNYEATGQGSVDWEPHPNGQGLMARTPHGDLHLTRDPDTGSWNWHAGPHGSQPGDEGSRKARWSESLTEAAATGIRSVTGSPFHGGLADELGKGWGPHPRSAGAFSRRLPSGDHAFVAKNADGTYGSGIQRDNGSGAPSTSRAYRDDMPDLAQALAFIHHRENPVPASDLGEGWQDHDRGPRHFPTYLHEDHPSGATAHVAWNVGQGGWRAGVTHGGDSYVSHARGGAPAYKTPHEAATWASSLMDDLGNK